MADVFISYSRHDEPFVRRLREALAHQGKDVWVDKEDIGPAVEWRRDIELGIEGADIFAFVITPDALASQNCRREREHAVAKKKHLVPLLHREPDGLPVPEELASRNYIFFRSEPEFTLGGRIPTRRDRGPARVGTCAHPPPRARGAVGSPQPGPQLPPARERPAGRRGLALGAGRSQGAAADARSSRS